MKINTYIEKFNNIRPNKSGDRERPHKICMLLAVLDLIKSGELQTNKIYLNPELIQRYTVFFKATAATGEVPNPHYPFFYLRGKLKNNEPSFWFVHPLPGREEHVATLEPTSLRNILDNVDYASLDLDLFELLKDPHNVERLEDSITRYWFDRSNTDLRSVIENSGAISNYEKKIKSGDTEPQSEKVADAVRDPAFRRLVTRIYDYRCAATGVRILLPTGEAMVEAAHIIPFSETKDDDPRNGLALTPDIHWAMDRNLIAPGPDKRWHVSKTLDPRIPDNQILTRLDNQPLLLPTELRFSPTESSLEWRYSQLRTPV